MHVHAAVGKGVAELILEDIKWDYSDGLDASVDVSISMVEKQGYAEEYRMHQIGGTRSNKRSDYKDLTDEEFANFRAVSTTGMGEYVLFRSSSPVKPTLGRNEYADKFLLDYGVRTIMNMADSEAEMKGYADYSLTSYARCDVIPMSMSMDFFAEDFSRRLPGASAFSFRMEGLI